MKKDWIIYVRKSDIPVDYEMIVRWLEVNHHCSINSILVPYSNNFGFIVNFDFACSLADATYISNCLGGVVIG